MNSFWVFSIKIFYEILSPLAAFTAALASGYLIRRIIFRHLRAWAKNTKT